MRRRLTDVLLGAIALVLLGITLGEICNGLAAAPLVIGVPYAPTLPAGASRIGIEECKRLLRQGGAVFVDAREKARFEAGHIRGALHVPPAHVLKGALPEGIWSRVQGAPLLVVYCDGPYCRGSERVATRLLELGVTPVRILADGWPAWEAAGLPTETGAPP